MTICEKKHEGKQGEVRLFNVAGGTKDTMDALDQVNGVAGLYLARAHAGKRNFV